MVTGATRGQAAPSIHFTQDGCMALQCFAEDPTAGTGDHVAFIDPGDPFDSAAEKVREHQAEHGCGPFAAQDAKPAPDIEAAFASGMRVRTAPCTADAHDREHFQVRTNGHWLCGHLLASMLAAQGIVAGTETQPAPELAAAMAKVRSALEDSPTAAIARREALEIVNALELGLPS